tara:strand:+ start:217 stop:507 length:291 start_codon:yes stop_codon:yes gene_type:complete
MDLLKMKDTIENKNKEHQIEILRILIENKVMINENNNGIFVNLSNVKKEIIDKINTYLVYVHDQENSLDKIETVKEEYKNIFFNNDLCKDNKTISI